MPKRHVASRGESVESIAYANGLYWETVWDAPENASLREIGREPNILEPGDVVFVPDLRPKDEPAPTGKRHVFRRRGVPSVLRVQLLHGGKPRSGLAFTVDAAGRRVTGTTDADGWVVAWLMPNATRGELRLDATGELFTFQVGTVSPVDTPVGVQTRLRNLGFMKGDPSSTLSAEAVDALRSFQRKSDLPDTGEPDEPTRAALVRAHGS